MVDLETVGLTVDAVVAQIGAVRFDPAAGELGPEFMRHVSIVGQARDLDADTALWWMGQEEAPRRAFIAGQRDAVPLPVALLALAEWLMDAPVDGLWSHGAAFDVPILEHCYRSHPLPVPWRYRAVRDTRTVFYLAGVPAESAVDDLAPLRDDEAKHNALTDARRQARAVCLAIGMARRAGSGP